MGTVRRALAGTGLQTAGLGFGGYTTANVSNTEEYNGTNWTTGGNLGTGRQQSAGAGTQTAGLGFGGYVSSFGIVAATEEYTSGLQTRVIKVS